LILGFENLHLAEDVIQDGESGVANCEIITSPTLPRSEAEVSIARSDVLFFQLGVFTFFHSRIRMANASSRSLPKATMPPSCPAMTRIFLSCTLVRLKRRVTSYAISGVPYSTDFELVGA